MLHASIEPPLGASTCEPQAHFPMIAGGTWAGCRSSVPPAVTLTMTPLRVRLKVKALEAVALVAPLWLILCVTPYDVIGGPAERS